MADVLTRFSLTIAEGLALKRDLLFFLMKFSNQNCNASSLAVTIPLVLQLRFMIP